jgi:uncharacterized protein (TIGR03382 family)
VEATPSEPEEPEDTGTDAAPEIETFGAGKTTARPSGCATTSAPLWASLLGLLALVGRRNDP